MMVNHGAVAEQVVVIPNGVDIETFSPASKENARHKLGLLLDKFIILYTGNLVPRKGVDVLLKAFQYCLTKRPNSQLVILGDGAERAGLEHIAHELGIAEQVHFAGFQILPEMPTWYQACDLFVMPSWAEGLSLSILEAMATAKPVVTTFPTVGKHDAVESNETGWLTAYGDVAELGRVLVASIERPELTQEMGQKARRLAEARFSWPAVAEQTIDIYREVLAEKEHDNRLYSL
jgi:glycosyltransferase involved in cell wall biosynthesis